jgi:hypothetical protein
MLKPQLLLALLLLSGAAGSTFTGRFVRQPESGTAGGLLAPAVMVNATAPAALDAEAAVALRLVGSPAGAQLLGQSWALVGQNGVADFGMAQLRYNISGNFTLDAFLLDKGRVDGKSDLYAGAPLLATSAPFELAAGAAARLDGGGWHASTDLVANVALQPAMGVALVDECLPPPPLPPPPPPPSSNARSTHPPSPLPRSLRSRQHRAVVRRCHH